MNKIAISLIAVLYLGFLGTIKAAESVAPAGLSGAALQKEDQQKIENLKRKKEELLREGGNASVIDDLIKLAEEMLALNDKRHKVHEATKSFEKAIGIFSEDIKQIIEKINKILDDQATAAVNNAKLSALIHPQSKD
ncbi:MAG: hypothetical protein WCJ92_00100 [Alphaproteobacteria bacterium]